MSEEHRCRNGNRECGFDDKHEQALACELMRAIEDYSNKENIDICPLCLRDTMLVIAALLHLEAARIVTGADRPHPLMRNISNALAKAARKALEDVAQAKAVMISSHSKH